MGYTVILPTLNESGHILSLIKDIGSVLSELKQKYEIIIVDDNSSDGTIDLVRKIGKEKPEVQLFVRENKKKNLAESINLGIQKSKYENIIWMDADFQHPPDNIKLFHNCQEKFDLIIFSRFLKDSARYFDNNISKKKINEPQSIFFNKLCRSLLYKDITDYTSGFICIKKKIFENYKLKGYYGDYFINLIIYSRLKNYSIIELPFTDKERSSGYSKTAPEFSLRYLAVSLNYILSLLQNYFKKKLKVL
jgi:dolichol-phosphate mannosyltransferase